MELGFDSKQGRLTYLASYALVDARFQTAFSEQSATNSTADAGGNIVVPAGSTIPGIPRNILKLRAEYLFGDDFTFGSHVYAASSQYARGNENNQDPSGRVGGYAVFNLDMHWRFAHGWELFGEIANLFDRKYETLGVLGTNFFNGPGHTFDPNNTTSELFVAPSCPARRLGRDPRFVRRSRALDRLAPGTARPVHLIGGTGVARTIFDLTPGSQDRHQAVLSLIGPRGRERTTQPTAKRPDRSARPLLGRTAGQGLESWFSERRR